MLSAREYDLIVQGSASGTSGLPSSGSASLSIADVSATILPLDDSSQARTASAAFGLTAEATGELKMSGAGSTSIGVTVAAVALIGILDAIGSASVAIADVASPSSAQRPAGEGTAAFVLTATASMLSGRTTPPERTASASFTISGALVPYAVGNMVGSALPYTELSPQSLASGLELRAMSTAWENLVAGSTLTSGTGVGSSQRAGRWR